MSTFIKVNSTTRHAARRLLTRFFASAEVRHWPNGRLGLELHNAINSGKLAEPEVRAALAAGELVDAPEEGPDARDVTIDNTFAQDHVTDKQREHAQDQFKQDAPQMQAKADKNAQQAKAPDKAKTATEAAIQAQRDALQAMMDALNAQAEQNQAEPEEQPALLDEESLRAIIRDEHSKIEHAAGPTDATRPAMITIKTEGQTRTVEGRKHAQFETLLRVISTRVDGNRRHAWVTGPMGSGKSTLNRQVAEAAGLDFYSCGSIASKYELIGFVPANGDMESLTLQTPLRRAYQKGGVFSFDDVDGSDPKALTAFLGALDGQKNYMFPDGMVDRHPDFVCIASANTWGTGATAEYVGRNKVDAAFLSRFAARIMVDYDEQLERDLVGTEGAKWAHYVQTLRKVVKLQGLKIPVTPRHTIDGHALMRGGMDAKLVKQLTVYAGLDDDTRNKLMKAVVTLAKENPFKTATTNQTLEIQE